LPDATGLALQRIFPPDLWRHKRLKKSEALFHRGQQAGTLYLVVSGAVRLAHVLPDGKSSQDSVTGPGSVIGEVSFFAGTFACDCTAVVESQVDYVVKPDILAHFERMPSACLAFARLLSDEVVGLREQMELMRMRSAGTRLLAWLQAQRARTRTRTIKIDRPWRDVAAHLGLTHEALYRALASLARERRIWREGRSVRLLGSR
jgi:CRP-like cAMP-binding protein